VIVSFSRITMLHGVS